MCVFVNFLDQPDEHLICPICKSVFSEPWQTSCGHRFCKSCLDPLLRWVKYKDHGYCLYKHKSCMDSLKLENSTAGDYYNYLILVVWIEFALSRHRAYFIFIFFITSFYFRSIMKKAHFTKYINSDQENLSHFILTKW